tara:strand:- start:20362 stop:20541 length:180 start_codon:yes stop_codon:yes gene_type:complete
MKGVNHYKKDGTLHKGGSHKMPDGSLQSGTKHSSSSVKLFHYGELSKKAKMKAKTFWGK